MAGARDSTNQLARAERDLSLAAGSPHRHQARALSTLSAVQQLLGKLPEANLAAQRAYEADAYLRDASAIVFRLYHTALDLKRYAEAAEWCDRGRRTYPREWLFLICQLNLMAWSPRVTPDVGKAWNVRKQLDTVASPDVLAWLRPQMTMMVAGVLARASLPDSAERVIAQANAAAPLDTQMLYYEVLVRVLLGQSAQAAGLLHELIQRNPNFVRTFRRDPAFTLLWNDPRLRALR
jgi:tetratricopeptide (TPR) repeat protein